MKILMALEGDFPPDLRVENEINSLIKRKHEVVLACYSLKMADSVYDWNGCKVHKKSISSFYYKSSVGALKFPFYFYFWRKFLDKIIQEEKPDAIHIHDLPLAKIGYELKQKYNIRFTLDLHENWPALISFSKHTNSLLGRILSSNKQWSKYEIDYCKKADNIIVVIEEAKTRLINLGVLEEKIEVVANYPELSDFEDLVQTNKTYNNYVLYYAGGINEHRGLQYIVMALPEIIKRIPNVEVRIFGMGNYINSLKKLAEDLNVSNYITFFGQVPYQRVLEELMDATIALIPHVKNDHTDNTIPHKLFQYIYAEKPVLASDCAPIERIINETKAGAVYRWNDTTDLAEQLNWLVKNIPQFKAINFKELIRKKYNWESEEEKLKTIYQ